jgi:putative phosphoribosyl transferase
MVVRKIEMPGQAELAIGAIALGNIVVHEPRIEAQISHLDSTFDRLVEEQRRELKRRENAYRRSSAPLGLKVKTVILADDGIATGVTLSSTRSESQSKENVRPGDRTSRFPLSPVRAPNDQ